MIASNSSGRGGLCCVDNMGHIQSNSVGIPSIEKRPSSAVAQIRPFERDVCRVKSPEQLACPQPLSLPGLAGRAIVEGCGFSQSRPSSFSHCEVLR